MDSVLLLLTEKINHGVREHFHHLLEKKNFSKDDVKAGREFVEAYVVFIHYVEKLYETATHPVEGHFPEEAGGGKH